MARIACITTGLAGILRASCALCKNMDRLGHEVYYASPFSAKEYVESQGLQYTQLEPYTLDTRSFSSIKAVISSWSFAALDKLIRTKQIDLIIIDQELHELILHLWKNDLNYVLLSQWFSLEKSECAPPMNTIGPADPAKKTHYAKLWQRQRNKRLIKHVLRRNRVTRKAALIHHMKTIAYPLSHHDPHGWPPPIRHRNQEIWHMVDEELQFAQIQSLVHEKYIGRQVDRRRKESINEQVAHEIQEVIKSHPDKIKILCTLSSMENEDNSILDRLVRVVSSMKDVIMLVAMGNRLVNEAMSQSPNCHFFQWLAPTEILDDIDLSINHGGIHTIQECIEYDVPMLIYSGGKYDQNGCASRVQTAQVGIMGNQSDRDQKIEKNIREALLPKYISMIQQLKKSQSDKMKYLGKLIDERLAINT